MRTQRAEAGRVPGAWAGQSAQARGAFRSGSRRFVFLCVQAWRVVPASLPSGKGNVMTNAKQISGLTSPPLEAAPGFLLTLPPLELSAVGL